MQSRGRGTFQFRCLTPFIMRGLLLLPVLRGVEPMPSPSPLPRFHFYAMHFADQESPPPLLDRILTHFTHEIMWITGKVGSSKTRILQLEGKRMFLFFVFFFF